VLQMELLEKKALAAKAFVGVTVAEAAMQIRKRQRSRLDTEDSPREEGAGSLKEVNAPCATP